MIRNGNTPHKIYLPLVIAMENDNERFVSGTRTHLQSQYDKRKFSSRDSVENIIEKYKHERLEYKCNKYSDQNLNRSKGEHALFHQNAAFNHQHFTISSNKNNHFSFINRNVENVVPKVTFVERNSSKHSKMKLHGTGLTSKEKLFADKTTNCRPVVSPYNKEFIYKILERNCKLKQLVKILAIERQRENDNVSWNNFINELKNKHHPSYNDLKLPHLPLESEQYITPHSYDDTRTSWQQSRSCEHLLQDFYEESYHPSQPTYRQPYENKQSHSKNPYDTNSNCYPISSQGRLIMLERERENTENNLHNRSRKKYLKYQNNHRDEILSKRYLAGKRLSNIYSYNNIYKNYEKVCINNDQKNHYFHENICNDKVSNKTENVLIDEVIQTFENDKNIQINHEDAERKMNNISLANIENKIETLISCINKFINEIKSNTPSKQKSNSASLTCDTNNNKCKEINKTKSDIFGKIGRVRRDELLGSGLFNDISESVLSVSHFYPCARLKEKNDILREIDKFSSKDNMPFKSQTCSVNITFEVPTKERSTEVTKSLSKQNYGHKVAIVEEISNPEPAPVQQITIAVNTDPFNLLTLLRISTEAVTRLITNVPNINLQSYLESFLQTRRKVESQYICNICGATFIKPSALSDHIEEHNLGKTRDCCVCRHVLDASRTPLHLFKCKFCGQRFTRAYCCELHQQRCAKLLGKIHDVASSLMLLR
ncbi:jg9666 [Pararge aegeria aegeria]|uniref:Jg9666 protein n=1 Tax=Pararge aegeria aegeria TaxID=348720 RepID=A0A8S4RRC6_9NEOP|nr:jg9666 [Pararge aegeria aegeria]